MRSKVALSGSGFRFFAHAGSLACLHEHTQITEVAGTSGGSLVAAIYAANPSIEHMVDIMTDVDTQKLLSFNFSALWHMGICKGKELERHARSVLGDITFGRLNIPLSITCTNLNTGEPTYFSTFKTPQVRVVDAIRASCAVPFVFTPHKIDNVFYVDGGLVNNIPVNVFQEDGSAIYAVNLESKDHHMFFRKARFMPEIVLHLIDIMMRSHSRTHLETASLKFKDANILNIDTSHVVKHGDTDIDDQEKFQLYRLGYSATKALFNPYNDAIR